MYHIPISHPYKPEKKESIFKGDSIPLTPKNVIEISSEACDLTLKAFGFIKTHGKYRIIEGLAMAIGFDLFCGFKWT